MWVKVYDEFTQGSRHTCDSLLKVYPHTYTYTRANDEPNLGNWSGGVSGVGGDNVANALIDFEHTNTDIYMHLIEYLLIVDTQFCI